MQGFISLWGAKSSNLKPSVLGSAPSLLNPL